MNPFQYSVLPIKRYVDFGGRSSRSEFWWFTLLLFIVRLIIGIIDVATFDPWSYDRFRFIEIISIIFNLFILLPSIAVSVRRLHDINRTGLWVLLWTGFYVLGTILMFVGGLLVIGGDFGSGGFMLVLTAVIFIGVPIWQIVWCCLPPVDQGNRFGPNPLLMTASTPAASAPSMPASTASTRSQQQPASSVSAPAQSSSVNDRLKDLNQMFEDGLIDEKEFKSKKKKLLDEL